MADFKNSDDLLKFIWAERRRELCFEEAMRFWDLRRQECRKSNTDGILLGIITKLIPLRQGSPNYVLGIPSSELTYNTDCVDNAREVNFHAE